MPQVTWAEILGNHRGLKMVYICLFVLMQLLTFVVFVFLVLNDLDMFL